MWVLRIPVLSAAKSQWAGFNTSTVPHLNRLLNTPHRSFGGADAYGSSFVPFLDNGDPTPCPFSLPPSPIVATESLQLPGTVQHIQQDLPSAIRRALNCAAATLSGSMESAYH